MTGNSSKFRMRLLALSIMSLLLGIWIVFFLIGISVIKVMIDVNTIEYNTQFWGALISIIVFFALIFTIFGIRKGIIDPYYTVKTSREIKSLKDNIFMIVLTFLGGGLLAFVSSRIINALINSYIYQIQLDLFGIISSLVIVGLSILICIGMMAIFKKVLEDKFFPLKDM